MLQEPVTTIYKREFPRLVTEFCKGLSKGVSKGKHSQISSTSSVVDGVSVNLLHSVVSGKFIMSLSLQPFHVSVVNDRLESSDPDPPVNVNFRRERCSDYITLCHQEGTKDDGYRVML